MFPILSEAARGERITVGQGYYEQVAMPIGIALLVLTGVGPADRLAQGLGGPAAPALRGAASRVALLVGDPARSLLTDVAARARPRAATVVAGVFVTACIAGEFWRGMQVRHALGGRLVARGPASAWSPATGAATAATSSTWASSSCSSAWPAPRASPPRPTSRCARASAPQVAGYTLVNEGATREVGRPQDDHQRAPRGLRGRRPDRHPAPRASTSSASTTRAPRTSPSTRGPSRDLYVVLTQLRGRRHGAPHRCSSTRWSCGCGSPA